ncbi:hybrid sensor histidine kinase/response regulator [Pedosphaera parvula]|uniref:histidine kinase n=1 Tax=Pedosphaera parvula (strain Ellin514) TaxID=320771 RepID=B9XAQ4_PEDPL|nr:response regulator [Pedosphaera parvula]EEF63089.1 multi-sensor signal transduction histidine kinase [Pedosphaera parvula Ellin514]
MSQAKPETILVVDDDLGVLRLIEKSLSRENLSVAKAESGAAAFEWLQENRPDLMLLDLKLADTVAKDFIARLSVIKRLGPFIIITGQGDERAAVEMMKSGAMDYVVKDAQFYDLVPTIVRKALEQIDRDKKLAAAEEALRISEERFRVGLKHSPISVFNQDTELRYTWFHNMPFAEPGKNVFGKTDEDLFPQAEADRLVQIKMRVLMTGTGVRQEVGCTVKDGQRVYDLTVEPVRDAEGRIVGITGAAMDITEHKRLEKEVLQISELEQRRIGQDLHDGICQHLAGIEMLSEVLGQKLTKKGKDLETQAENIAAQIRNVIAQTRSLARGLSPVVLESEGLMAALSELAVNTEKLFSIKCRFECLAPVYVHDLITATHLFRIAQEAVANAIKHGKAAEIEIGLESKLDKTILAVRDNGIGIPPTPGASRGMGLRTMHYRAGMIGATLLFQRQNKGGTAVVCFLPAGANSQNNPGT